MNHLVQATDSDTLRSLNLSGTRITPPALRQFPHFISHTRESNKLSQETICCHTEPSHICMEYFFLLRVLQVSHWSIDCSQVPQPFVMPLSSERSEESLPWPGRRSPVAGQVRVVFFCVHLRDLVEVMEIIYSPVLHLFTVFYCLINTSYSRQRAESKGLEQLWISQQCPAFADRLHYFETRQGIYIMNSLGLWLSV